MVMKNKLVLLAENYSEDIDPTGYWLSEKLDGIRALWDGHRFISRNGLQFAAPTWFHASYPPFKLDGELWLGRGQFNETSSIVRSSRDKGWNRLRFMSFDIAERKAGIFEDRQKILLELHKVMNNKYFHVVPQTPCIDKEYFKRVFDLAIKSGAEGIMLRKPKSMYELGRSRTLLKAKPWYDAEAEVIGYEAGEGKYARMMGALRCIDANGREFKVGTGFSDAQRSDPPPLKSRITYKYKEITEKGAPREPVFVAVRDYE